MLTSFTVKNYRLFDNLTVDSLSRINLIAGKNNVGKTSLLEALWIYGGAANPGLSVGVNSHRGIEAFPSTVIWDNLFRNFDPHSQIQMSANQGAEPGYQLSITLEEPEEIRIPVGDESKSNGGQPNEKHFVHLHYLITYPTGETLTQSARLETEGLIFEKPARAFINTVFLPAQSRTNPKELAERYQAIEKDLAEETVVRGMKVVEPRLIDIRAAFTGQIPTFQCRVDIPGIKNRRIPLNYLGSGLYRYFEILCAMIAQQREIILIDEIENGIHHSVMPKVWQAIDQFAEELNVQVFATTHSWDCINAAYDALKDRGSLRLHRLQEREGKIEAVSYSDDALIGAIENEVEVR